ncbi:MAG: glycosyltransferase, partial [Pseudomonadota bacterium]|nr:glycosyltransferase [Pseudomonadota bacterium]
MPRLSIAVIVRTQDRPNLLTRSLSSLAEQKRLPDEVIVINDGGVAIDNVISQYPQLNIHLINNKTAQGRAQAGNCAVEASQSEVIGFLDDDDRWLADHLQRLEKALLLFDAQVAYSGCRLVQRDTLGDEVVLREQAIGEFNEPFEPKRLRYENYIPLINVLIDRALWQRVGGFDSRFDIFEDWDLMLRLAEQTTFYHVNRITAEYAIWGPGQITQRLDQQRWLHAYEQFLTKHWLTLPQAQQVEELAEFWRVSQQHRGIARERLEENRSLQLKFLDNLQKLEDAQRQLHHYQDHHNQLQQHITQLQSEWRQKYEQLQKEYTQLQQDWSTKYEQQQFYWQQKSEQVHAQSEQLQADWRRKYEQLQTEYSQLQHDWQGKYEQLHHRYEQLHSDWQQKYEQLQYDWQQKYEQSQHEYRQSERQIQSEWQQHYQQLQIAYDQQEAHFKQQQQEMLQEIDNNIERYQQLQAYVHQQQQQCQDWHHSIEELHHQLTLGLTQGHMERILSSQPPLYSGQLNEAALRPHYQRLAHWCLEQHQQLNSTRQYWETQVNVLRDHAERLQSQLHQLTVKAVQSRWLHYGGYVKLLDKINLSAQTLTARLNEPHQITAEVQQQELPPPRPLSGLHPSVMTFGGELSQPQLMEYVSQHSDNAFHLGPNATLVFATYCSIDNFFRIDLAIATYMRINACQLRLIIRQANQPQPLRVVQFSALTIIDNLFHPIYFEPISDSAGKTYHLELDSPDASDQHAVAIWCPSQPLFQPEPPPEPSIPLPRLLPHWLQYGLFETPLPPQIVSATPTAHVFVLTGVTEKLSLPIFLHHLGKVVHQAQSHAQVIIAGELSAEIQAYCAQHQLLTLPQGELAAILRWGQQAAQGEWLWYCHVQALPPLEVVEQVNELFNDSPTTALAVPLQIHPHNNRIVGAYALIDQYGHLHHFPLNQPADHPYHGYRRVIDAASSDLLVFKTQYLQHLELDKLADYHSMAYRVTELIWQLKAAQLDTVYDAAFYYHDERELPYPESLAADRALLYQRWHSAFPQGLILNQHTLINPQQRPTLLIIDATLPAYDEDSGSLRLYILMKLFIKLGYKVTFFPDNLDSKLKYRQALQALGVEVFHGHYTIVEALSYRRFTLAIVCRVEMGQRYIPFLRLISPKTQIFYDTIDIHYIREQRQAEIEQDPQLAAQAQMTQRKELANCLLADRTLTVTEEDARHLQKQLPYLTYSVVPNVHPLQPVADTTFEQREGLVFIGNYHHQPNEDAVYFFIDAVLPHIQAQLPEICLYLIGSNMKPQ